MTQTQKRDKSKKRKAILEGAIQVFVDMGYEQASMDKMAETAGVSKRTIYNHFGSKENLFQAIIDEILAQRQRLKSISYSDDTPLEDQLLAFAHAELYLIDSPKRLGLSRFLTGVFLRDITFARETVAKYPPHYDMLLQWLIAAGEAGKIKTENPLLAARMFYAMVEGAITWPTLFSEGMDPSAVEPIVREIVSLFLARYGCD